MSEPLSRRDFLKVGGLALAGLIAEPILNLETTPPHPDLLKVGDLNVHFLPLDHVDRLNGLPDAVVRYDQIKAAAPDVVPLVEYFPPEIESEIPNWHKPIELEDIKDSYGLLIDFEKIDRVLVADPAYNAKFLVPKLLPIAAGFGTSFLALKEITGNLDDELKNKHLSRRQFLKLSAYGLLGLLGISTIVNSGLEQATGMEHGLKNPPKLANFIDENDFRHLTVAYALEKLGKTTDQVKTENIALVFPEAHLNGIAKILAHGTKMWIQEKVKFDYYKLLYSWLDIMNIREWTHVGEEWQITNQIPITGK